MPEAITTRPNPDPTVLTTEQLHHEMGWIKDLIEQKISTVNERISGSIREVHLLNSAAQAAVAKSEVAYEKRFHTLNELRQIVTDREVKFMTATESRALHKSHEDKMSELTNRFNLRDGRDSGEDSSKNERRAGQGEARANISIGIAVLTTIGAIFLFLSNLSSKVERNTDARVIPTAPMPATPSPSR